MDDMGVEGMDSKHRMEVTLDEKLDHVWDIVADIKPTLIPDQPKLFNKSCKRRRRSW